MADIYDQMTDSERRSVINLVAIIGRELDELDEWSLDVNMNTTEAVYDVYCRNISRPPGENDG